MLSTAPTSSTQILNAAAITQALSAECRAALAVEVVAQTTSTNSDLLAQTLTHPWHARFAVEQTAGRGRRGKPWHAAAGDSLTFSLAWCQGPALAQLSGLPLVAGLAIQRRLRNIGVAAQLKWPNDIWVAGRKLGGILVETEGSATQPKVVIGVGLNLRLPASMQARIQQAATGLQAHAEWPDLNVFAASLLNELHTQLLRFAMHGFAPFQAEFNQADALQGEVVTAYETTLAESAQTGWCRGVDAQGRLLLETAQGLVVLHAGEVSLRPAAVGVGGQ